MRHYSRLSALRASAFGVIAITSLILLGGCIGSTPASSSDLSASDSVAETSTATAAEAQSSAANMADPSTSPSALTPSTQANVSVLALDTDEAEDLTDDDYDVRLLTDSEISRIESELGADYRIITEHSFSLNLSDVDEMVFVASELVNSRSRANEPFLDIVYPGSALVSLPEIEYDWWFWGVRAVSFADINDDDLGPDIIVMSEYITGIGPTGAEPFPVTSVYFCEGDGIYSVDAAINDVLFDGRPETIAEAKEILRDEL